MAIINCPECSKEISDKAPTCPQCGSPNNAIASQVNQTVSQQVVTYKTNKASLLHRIMTGNIVPSKMILDWISFHDNYFELQTRKGAKYKFDYEDCVATDNVLGGRIDTVTLLLKSKSRKQKVKLHIIYPEELQKGEVNDIKQRLNVGLRSGLLG
jgi:hypothetical protein